MLKGRGLLAVACVAAAVTLAMAWPVMTRPREMMFGHEIVGRHHDSYTVVAEFAGAGMTGTYAQPMTDGFGWLLARRLDPVAAFNVIVLLSFPLAAIAAYALGRYLTLSHTGALAAALAYAFAPVHLAHAAYHPHIAQTQWFPVFFLALFAMVDAPSFARALWLAAASAALTLTNDYAGWTAAVMTPVALPIYWLSRDRDARRWRDLGITALTLAVLAAIGLILIAWLVPSLAANPHAFSFPIEDVTRYSARWWAFFVPPVDHAVLGAHAAAVFARGDVRDALVENQIYLGVTLTIAALVPAVMALAERRWPPLSRMALSLLAIALVAALIAIGPAGGDCAANRWAPACALYAVAPMFRAYARFAIVTQLMLALAAGAGITALLARRTAACRVLAAALMIAGAFEYWPFPPRAHDILPTLAHRWVAAQPAEWRVLDCVRPSSAEALVPRLMHRNIAFLGAGIDNCTDPESADRLAAFGYTHMLVRRATDGPVAQAGFSVAAAFPDSLVYAVAVPVPHLIAIGSRGFFEREFSGRESWRWMSDRGEWTVRNTTSIPQRAALSLRLAPAGASQTIAIQLDGRPAGQFQMKPGDAEYTLGPWSFAPGDHTLAFTALEPSVRPSDDGHANDRRRLTVMFKSARWIE